MTFRDRRRRRVRHRPCRPRNPLSTVAVLAALVAIAAAGGCTGAEPAEDSRTPLPSVPAPTQDARGRAEEAALDAYRGMWRAYAKAGLTANPDEPSLPVHTTGEALTNLKNGLAKLRRDGEVIKGEYQSDPQVTEASPAATPSSISVQDCLNTARFLTYKTATGALADDVPGGNRAVRATVTRDDGGWKVSSFGVQAVGSC